MTVLGMVGKEERHQHGAKEAVGFAFLPTHHTAAKSAHTHHNGHVVDGVSSTGEQSQRTH